VVENNVGVPINGAKLYFYLTGTTTPHDTWSDVGLTTPNTNPVVADSSGRFPNVFLDPTVAYKVVLTDSAGVQIWTADPVQGVPPISQQPDLGGAWFTINLLDGGLVDTSQTTSQNILVHVDPLVETGITYLGNADPGTVKRIRVDEAADIFFGYDNGGQGQTLYGFNQNVTDSYTPSGNGNGRLTICPNDVATFVALDTSNHVGDRCWLLVDFKSAQFVSYMLRPGGNGHNDPPDYLFLIGKPSFLQTQPNMPCWSVMMDPTANGTSGKIYTGEWDLNTVGDVSRGRLTAFKADPVTGEPVLTSLWANYISGRPGIISPDDGKLNFTGPSWAPAIPNSPESLYQGWNARITFDTPYDPTATSTPGVLAFGAATGTQDGATYGVTPWIRAWLSGPSGNFILAGKSAFEQNTVWTFDPVNPATWYTPAAYCNYRDTKGHGNLHVVMSDITAARSAFNAAIAMRGYNDDGYGVDFGYDGVDWGIYNVSGGVRTRMVRLRPGTSTWLYDNSGAQYTITSAGGLTAPIQLVNSDSSNGSATGLFLQAGPSGTNNVASVYAKTNGLNQVAVVLSTANNAPGQDALIMSATRAMQLPGYGAGTLQTDASGNVTASSDERLKIMLGAFADTLPPAPAGSPDTAAIAAFRAVGRAQLWHRRDEQQAITDAIAALPELLAARDGETTARQQLEDAAADARIPLTAAVEAAQAALAAIDDELKPLGDVALQAHDLQFAISAKTEDAQALSLQLNSAPDDESRGALATKLRDVLQARAALRVQLAQLPNIWPDLSAILDRQRAAMDALDEAKQALAQFEADHISALSAFDSECAGRKALIETAERYASLADIDGAYTTYIGVSAQQLQRGAPVGVKTDPNGLLTKDDRAEMALHTEVIFDLLDRDAAQTQQIEQLTQQVVAMTAQIADLTTKFADLTAKVAALTPPPAGA